MEKELMEAEVKANLPLAIHHLKGQGYRVWVARNPEGEIMGITVDEDAATEWRNQGRMVSEDDYGLQA